MYLILFFRSDLLITQLALPVLTTKCIHFFRSAEIKPLQIIHSQRAQTVHLRLCFHTFCHRINTQLSCQPDNTFHDMPGCLFTQNVLCETPVHFYITDRKVLQLRQYGTSGSEIIQRKCHSGITQPAQFLFGLSVHVKRLLLCQLQNQMYAVMPCQRQTHLSELTLSQ